MLEIQKNIRYGTPKTTSSEAGTSIGAPATILVPAALSMNILGVSWSNEKSRFVNLLNSLTHRDSKMQKLEEPFVGMRGYLKRINR